MKSAESSADQLLTEVSVRLAVAADLCRIADIHDQGYPTGAIPINSPAGNPDNWDTWWKSHTPSQHPVWVHEEHGQIMAWISLSPFYRQKVFCSTVQCSIYVVPGAQRRGIGTGLIQQIMAMCPALGIRTVLAFIAPQNEASLKVFNRAGFEPWGEFPQSAQSRADAIDMVMLGRKVG